MAATAEDARFRLAREYGFPGTREQWDALRARAKAEHAERELAERQERLAGFQRAKRSRKSPTAAIGRERPAWQRRGRLPRRMVAVLENPRVRGQTG